jgi:hypothetical protein
MSKITVEFEGLKGDWGQQLGWVSVGVQGSIPGLRLHRLPVFKTDTGDITFGMPMLQGELPGSRYSGITFDTDKHRERFLRDLSTALRATHPELFDRGVRL